jgi:hypothetical protein
VGWRGGCVGVLLGGVRMVRWRGGCVGVLLGGVRVDPP